MTAQVAAHLSLAVGSTACLFGLFFRNMTPLSAGFAERSRLALLCAAVGWSVGLLIAVVVSPHRKPGRRARFRPGSRTGYVVRTFVLSVLCGWMLFAFAIYALQERLLFNPRTIDSSRLLQIATEYPLAERLSIRVDDDITLHGWFLPPTARAVSQSTANGNTTERYPLVIVFAGQGGEASSYLSFSDRLPQVSWVFVNYRGYGLSGGTPSDKALFDDALVLYDYLTSRHDVDENNVFVLGGSLGTGVATYLAAHRPLAGVILFSPYDRIAGGVAQDMMPWVPTKLLLKNQFDARKYAPAATAPALAIVAEDDFVTRPDRSRELMRAWGQPHRLLVITGADHYSVYDSEVAWRGVDGFVRGLLR